MYSRALLMAYLLFRNSFLKLFLNLLTNIIIRKFANNAIYYAQLCENNFCQHQWSIDMIAFERIKKLAKQKHLSLVEINDKAGLGTRTIYHWNKTKPSNDNLKAVAKVLSTTTDYLNGLTDDPTIPDSNVKHKLTWRDLGQEYGGDSPVPDEFQTMVDSLAEGYFKAHPELRKKNDDQ